MSVSFDAPFRSAALPIAARVEHLLARMTLEEKLAQMSILEMKTNNLPEEEVPLDAELKAQLAHGVGALGRPGLTSPARNTALYTNSVQKYLREQTRLGIPAFFVDEALHGLMADGSTFFPQAIGLASTWDPELVEKVFTAAAKEMRVRGGNWALTPVLDLARDPRWGRTEETYGEDPHLGARIGVAAVRGLQGRHERIGREHVLATAKHFAVHGQPEAGTNSGPANYAEREIRENFLPAFQAAVVEAGAGAVMASYNEINGIPVHVNRWLLGEVLRREWGFAGILTSDGNGISQLETLHHVAGSKAEAARKVLAVGMDFELDNCFATLHEQVRSGIVPEAQIDAAVRRVLAAKFRLGLFDDPYADPEEAERVTNCAEHRALALQAARESLVLLKNDGLLPLAPAMLRTLAVIGPNAAGVHLGGYSAKSERAVSILDGLRAKLDGRAKVLVAEGCRITANQFAGREYRRWWEDEVLPPDPETDARLIAEAVETARQADAVVLVLGENESVCREGWSRNHLGDRDSLDLPGRQEELARAVTAVGKPVVVLLINGRPLSINWIEEHVPAIFEGWYLGQEGGTAFAEALFGELNPGGKLPISFPRSAGQIPAFYNHKPSARRGYLFADVSPLYPFGHGLSYTTFAYSDLKVEPVRMKPAATATVSVTVANTGTRAGDEVVQFYVHDVQSDLVTRPVKALKGFQRITLEPGEERVVSFRVGPEQLAYLDEHMRPVVEPGLFELMIGTSSTEVQTIGLEVLS
jgi:beta-glucosidase